MWGKIKIILLLEFVDFWSDINWILICKIIIYFYQSKINDTDYTAIFQPTKYNVF